MKKIIIKTNKKEGIIDITEKVKSLIPKNFSGMCNVFVKHATAAIIINENYDLNLCQDILNCLDKLIPQGVWKHDKIDGNGAAHIKAAILGPSENIPVENGKLMLGRWQGIGLVELDGVRKREINVSLSKI